MAQTHVLTSERPEELQKDKAEQCSALELHFELIFGTILGIRLYENHIGFCLNGSAQKCV